MKKKLLVGAALSICAVSAFSYGAFAEEQTITTFDELKNCVESTEPAICNIAADINIASPLTSTSDITINLNSHTIGVDATQFTSGKDKGMITVNHGAELNINGGGTITTGETDIYSAIRLTSKDDTDDSKPAIVNVDGATLEGYYYAIVGNGSEGRGNTEINLSAATVKGLNSADSFGIFHPQTGTLNINSDTVVEGNTGLGIKSGTLNLKGGTIHGLGDLVEDPAPHGNGMNMSGAAIAAEYKQTYADNTTLNIEGGLVTSNKGYAIHEYNDGTKAGIKSISITGGEFQGGAGLIKSSDLFSPAPFIADGIFHITEEFDILITAMALPGSAITTDAELTKVIISSKTITSEDLPEGAETFVVYYDADFLKSSEEYMETIKEVLEAAGISGKEVALYLDISIYGLEDNHNLPQPATFDILIPEELRTPAEGYNRTWTVLREHITTPTDPITYTELPATLDAQTGELSFSSDKFSQFLVLYQDTKEEDPIIPKAPDSGIVKEYAKNFSLLPFLPFFAFAIFIVKRSYQQ